MKVFNLLYLLVLLTALVAPVFSVRPGKALHSDPWPHLTHTPPLKLTLNYQAHCIIYSITWLDSLVYIKFKDVKFENDVNVKTDWENKSLITPLINS